MSLGILEMSSGTAESLVEVITEKLTAIASSMQSINAKNTTEKLVSSIKNTLSDKMNVNPAFNTLFENLRKEVLPKYCEKWDLMNAEEQKNVLEMGHFFCRMHLLVTFAEESNKVLMKFEEACLEGKSQHAFPKPGESGTCRLIRTACKAFPPRGHQAAGMPKLFDAYLTDSGNKNQLVTMEGNRFNIIFVNGGAVFYHQAHMKGFIMQLSERNNLMKAVYEDAENSVFVAGARALGIIGKLITGPLMRYIYGSGGNILELNPILQKLHTTLKMSLKMHLRYFKQMQLFDEELVSIKKDEIYKCLFMQQDEEMEILTQQALELICAGMLVTLERQAEEQLDGGSLSNPSDNLQLQASNVPQHNMASERDFALFDNLLRFRPNATLLCIEAIIMWVHNNPSKWLQSLPETLKDKYFKEARENYALIKGKLNERKQTIFKERKEKLERMAAEKKEKKPKMAIFGNLLQLLMRTLSTLRALTGWRQFKLNCSTCVMCLT